MSEAPSHRPTDGDIWNPHQCLKRMGHDADLLSNMIDYFQEDAPELLNKLSSTLKEGDCKEATRFAHSLKGLCANYDATEAIDAALKVEEACREQNASAAQTGLPLVRERIKELSVALKRWQALHQS